MAPTIKLHFFPGSCSMASQLLLEDSGLTYEPVQANLRDPDVRAEYVKNVNSKGQVPALQIDNETITEAPAVLTAISNLVPEKHYTGKTPMENIRFYEWVNFLSGTMHGKYFGALFRPEAFSADPAAVDGIKAQAKQNVLKGFGQIEERLAARPGSAYALGDSLTGVDGYLIVMMAWARRFELDLAGFPNYNQFFDKISQTPSFKAMMRHQEQSK